MEATITIGTTNNLFDGSGYQNGIISDYIESDQHQVIEQLETYLKTFKDHPFEKFDQFRDDDHDLIISRIKKIIAEDPRCFERDAYSPGHFTGSAMVLNRSFDQVLLTFHAKLKMWLQLGGHADGDSQLHNVAMREAIEESGIEKLSYFDMKSLSPSLSSQHFFDYDVHLIPAVKQTPEHYHFDVRYILIAQNMEIKISQESLDLRWFTFEEARKMTDEKSMHRQFDKIEWIKQKVVKRDF